MSSHIVWLGEQLVDLERAELRGRGGPVRLTSNEVALLRYLALHRDRAVPRDELLAEVWGYQPSVVTRAVDFAVSRLRRKLEDEPRQPVWLQTVTGAGYRLRVTNAPAPAGSAALPSVSDGSMVGRTEILQRLQSRLQHHALVCLTGLAGIGKTTLARHLAARCASRFVDLSEAHTAEQMCWAVSQQLACAPDAIPDTLHAGGEILLVLDNLEQLPASALSLLPGWLAAAPSARILATSRRRLGLPGEFTVEPGPLSAEDAARLFLARSEAAGGLTFGVPTPEVVHALVSALDCIPLAVELAAGCTPLISASALLERAGSRLELTGPPTLPGRHRSLRRALDTSWRLLSAWEQLALAQLSVFRGGFSLEAAETVLDLSGHDEAPWVPGVLASLRAQSLLRRVADDRLNLFLAVRDYADGWLARPDSVAGPEGEHQTRQRHAEWLLQMLEPRTLFRRMDRGGKPFIDALSLENDNIVAAIRFASRTGQETLSMKLSGALHLILWHSGRLQGLVDIMVEVRDGLSAGSRAYAACTARITNAMVRQGRLTEAWSMLVGALEAARQAGEEDGERRMLTPAGLIAMRIGMPDKARQFFLRQVELGKRSGSENNRLSCALNATICLEQLLRCNEAMAGYRTQRPALLKAQLSSMLCVLDGRLAGLLSMRGEVLEAEVLFAAAMKLAVDIGFPWMSAHIGLFYAQHLLRLGALEAVAEQLEHSASQLNGQDHANGIRLLWELRTALAMARGSAAVWQHMDETLAHTPEGYAAGLAWLAMQRAILKRRDGDAHTALKTAREALVLATQTPDRTWEPACRELLADLLIAAGKGGEALVELERLSVLLQEAPDIILESRLYCHRARLESGAGERWLRLAREHVASHTYDREWLLLRLQSLEGGRSVARQV